MNTFSLPVTPSGRKPEAYLDTPNSNGCASPLSLTGVQKAPVTGGQPFKDEFGTIIMDDEDAMRADYEARIAALQTRVRLLEVQLVASSSEIENLNQLLYGTSKNQ